jgi:hypothetical protein
MICVDNTHRTVGIKSTYKVLEMRIRQSFWGLLGVNSPQSQTTDDAVKCIRTAMLDAMVLHCPDSHEDLRRRIDFTPDIQSLWYVRPDLMHAISACQGETTARQVLAAIAPLFQGAMPTQKQHDAAIAKSLVSADDQAKVPGTSMNVLAWLRNLAGATTSQKEVANSRLVHNNSSLSAAGAESVVDSAQSLSAMDEIPVVTESEKAALVVGGLNFLDAIAAHQKWKSRLASQVAGTSTEKLDYRMICRDDQCVLGKWINGPGSDSYGSFPVFSRLKMTHAQFHVAAGAIVRLVDEGKTKEAHTALRLGEYSQHSIKVQGLISSLYLEVNP